MTRSPVRYRAIPPSVDSAHRSGDHEAEVDGVSLPHFSVHTEARTKWTYFLLGCAILLPWNVLMNGTSFFLSRLIGSPFRATFGSYLSSIFMLSKLSSQFYSTITLKQSLPSRRILVSLNVAILLVVSLCISTFIRGAPSTFFIFVVLNTTSLAATAGYMCTSVYAVASHLGASFLQTVISGHAAIAVIISAIQLTSSVVSLWGSSPEPDLVNAMVADDLAEELAARIFFCLSAAFLCITLLAYMWLEGQPSYKSFTAAVLEVQGEVGSADELTGLVAGVHSTTEANSRVYHVLKRNITFMFSIAYVFSVTLAIFPAITVRIQPVSSGIHPMLFTAVHFLVYNIGDLVGRYACSFPSLVVWSVNKILAMSLLRTLFIPLILLCNIERPGTLTPPIINSDLLYMVILLAMGYTNGYVVSTAILAVSSLEHNPGLEGCSKYVDVAATLGGSFTIVGLTTGALCSFVVQAIA